ncbi:MAG: hypothetical protein ACERKV_04270 [Clostridiaceae bacterium]
MLKVLPERFNKKWLIIYLITFILLYIIFLISGNGVFNKESGKNFYLSMFYLAIIPSTMIFIFGFLGAKIIYIFSTVGIFLGTLFIIFSSKQATGWEDLAAVAGLLFTYAVSLGIGIAAQIGVVVSKKIKQANK